MKTKSILVLLIALMNLPLLADDTTTVAGSSYFQAVEEYKLRNYGKSVSLLKVLLTEGKATYESYALLAYNYDKLNDFENAYSAIQEARKRKPDDENLASDMLGILAHFKKWKAVIEICEKFVPMYTSNAEIRYFYALALASRGAGKVALSQIEKAKANHPNDVRFLELEGKIYYSLKSYEKADVSLRWASSINDKSPSVWNNLALVQEAMYFQNLKLGKKKDAVTYLEEAKLCIQRAENLAPNQSSIKENGRRISAIPSA
jgi:Flp pilus assembly protein TadD